MTELRSVFRGIVFFAGSFLLLFLSLELSMRALADHRSNAVPDSSRNPRSFTIKPAGTYRIYFQGDSAISEENLHPEEGVIPLTKTQLLSAHSRIDVVDASSTDIGIEEQVNRVEQTGLHSNPDLIVLAISLNTARLGAAPHSQTNWLARHSRLWQALHQLLFRVPVTSSEDLMLWVRAAKTLPWKTDKKAFFQLIRLAQFDWGSAWNEPAARLIDEQLSRLQLLVAERHIPVMIVVFPVDFQVLATFDEHFPQDVIIQLCKLHKFSTLDVLPVLRKQNKDSLFLNHYQLASAGRHIVSEAISRFIEDEHYLNMPVKSKPEQNAILCVLFSACLWIFLFGAIAVKYFRSTPRLQIARQALDIKSSLIVIVSTLFLHLGLHIPFVQISNLIGLLTFLYMALSWASRYGGKTGSSMAVTIILGVLLFFTLIKCDQHLLLTGVWNTLLPIVGFSYLTLKLISFASLEASGLNQSGGLLRFLGYCLYAPTFVAGPILEFSQYQEQLALRLSLAERLDLMLNGVKRIIVGLFKINVLSRFTHDFTFYNMSQRTLLTSPYTHILIFIYITFLDLYLNFSGYTDLGIGVSNCFGLSLTENFNYPFIARNLQDFWQRWHISFSNWLKKYLYLPLNKFLLKSRLLGMRPILAALIALLSTFALMGLWHGFGSNYLLYGLVQGVGLCGVVMWNRFLKKCKIESIYRGNPVIHALSCFITFNYFAFSLLIFFADTPYNRDLLMTVAHRVFMYG